MGVCNVDFNFNFEFNLKRKRVRIHPRFMAAVTIWLYHNSTNMLRKIQQGFYNGIQDNVINYPLDL